MSLVYEEVHIHAYEEKNTLAFGTRLRHIIRPFRLYLVFSPMYGETSTAPVDVS